VSHDRTVAAIRGIRVYAAPDERELHRLVAAALDAAGITHRHEVKIGPRMRVDFLTDDGVGIEVKRGKTWGRAVDRQVRGYLGSDQITSLILYAERAVFVVGETGHAKPVSVVFAAEQWGVGT
jgi:hypothetical protein